MSNSDELLAGFLPGRAYIRLYKRTQNGSSDPYVLPVTEVNTWEKLLKFSKRIFDIDSPPRVFTGDNCPVPPGFWADILLGAGRSGQCFYLEIHPERYTGCKRQPPAAKRNPSSGKTPPPEEINLVILLEYPAGLFSKPPDDLIVEPISPYLCFEKLAQNMKFSLFRDFAPTTDFSILFENAAGKHLSPERTIAECGLSHGQLVHCRLGDPSPADLAETESSSPEP
ncbi:uncharacterized protein H6S33_007875 [Morchella sextelata]|uniref:uncharacterized protein n=1 Tax=Morchella sextelata TaxID=1174677 RepID=UPI001D0542F6|nr:uncharacterized protein H6S33_007875 [Morchella sextelata]KAH0603553.1 hypothetical protein H6S33_007875 [Morchella sextelata]